MMKSYRKILLFLLFPLSTLVLNGQTSISLLASKKYAPKTTTYFTRIGESPIAVKVMQYGESKKLVYINVHADEYTSLQAAQRLLQQEGGMLIKIENNNKRNIRFRLRGKYYTFDPNRMFSREGASQTLAQLSRTNQLAIEEITKFGQRILQLIPENPLCIIALHNNTEGKFGINSYLPGAERETDARKVYADTLQDPDDIFLTTDSILYHRLSAEKYNTIWQDNEKVRRDGSLSVYCGERNITYLNCETQHGKTEQYLDMLLSATGHIGRLNEAGTGYTYSVQLNDPTVVNTTTEVFFGEKRIGQVRSVNSNDSATISGIVEINKDFNLYSNMDLFLVNSPAGSTRIDLRIDPTRSRELLNPATSVISIAARLTAE
jgi:hypothetical protein